VRGIEYRLFLGRLLELLLELHFDLTYLLVFNLVKGEEDVLAHVVVEPSLLLVVLTQLPEQVFYESRLDVMLDQVVDGVKHILVVNVTFVSGHNDIFHLLAGYFLHIRVFLLTIIVESLIMVSFIPLRLSHLWLNGQVNPWSLVVTLGSL
jgi:hypothetical protein